MAYVAMDRRDWARPELEKLSQKNADKPLYLYWLARLDYDAQQYPAAIQKLEQESRQKLEGAVNKAAQKDK